MITLVLHKLIKKNVKHDLFSFKKKKKTQT